MTSSLPSGSDTQAAGSGAFDLLHQGVRRWIWREGWNSLHDVQERSIPVVLEGSHDVVIAAATAAGKTEAAFLPICSSLATDPPVDGLGALYISPLKALINDQQRRMEGLGDGVGLDVTSWHGDVPADRKRRVREQPSGILLITPESVEALFVNHGTSVARMFGSLRYVVIDELHAFIGTERGRQLQSLLHRIELATRRRVPRLGLSATLGDMATAGSFLRPGSGDEVRVISSSEDGRELKVQLRGYRATPPRVEELVSDKATEFEDLVDGDELEIADHLFQRLRGEDNLVFANARTAVEHFADLLRRRSERERVPNEFWPHHGNLSKPLREQVEHMLRSSTKPTTAICTSTLELGIDVGSVANVAQIGAPFSVASMRQRLGRSGRRPGDPSVLRMYVTEQDIAPGAQFRDDLRQEVVQSIAIVQLLVEGWYEPPIDGALHLSTLVQQILSVIAQHGGARADDTWQALCGSGPFHLDQDTFSLVLRGLAERDVIQQAGDGELILAPVGERIVGHYSFYSAFVSPEEYRLVADGQEIGSLPISFSVSEGTHLIFGGRRWVVVDVDDERKVIAVVPSRAGRAPAFSGGGGPIHDGVRTQMRKVYEEDAVPTFLDAEGERLLKEGRRAYREQGLARRQVVQQGSDAAVFPWVGDRAMSTIALGLATQEIEVALDGVGLVAIGVSPSDVMEVLADVFSPNDPPDPLALASLAGNARTEKHHVLLGDELLFRDHASARLDINGAVRAVARLELGDE